MHVGLNLIYLVPGETGGTEVVAKELLPCLVSAAPEDVRFTLFINREASESRGGVWSELAPAVTVPVHARRRAEWVRGEQELLPRLASRAGVDIVHSLANTGPARGGFRRVVTIHDLNHRVVPEAHFGVRSLGMRVLVSIAARRSHRVIADSESTRQDLVKLLGLPPAKVDVAPLGVGTTASAGPLDEATLRAKHKLGDRPLLLSVSAKRPHKNLIRLLEALSLIPPERRPMLVLPGYPTPHEDELRARATALGLRDSVRLLGWIPDEDIEGLYAASDLFAFPSLYEGFGMPVLEAMARGVPVVCSDRGSLREVAGNAARLFDPESPRAIATAIEAVLTSPDTAAALRAAGREQAARFTWTATAKATLQSYERALAGPSEDSSAA